MGIDLKRPKYRLLGLVGQGQFGRVYCASHRKTGRLFALKDLDRARFPTHKFLRELRFLLSLQHPNIVTCHALEHTRTGRYLVMDYCEGGTLRGLMEEEVRLHPVQSLKLVAALLEGLEHAHSKSIIHCDIKPENILLNVQPTGWMARISDFGISRLIQEINSDGEGNTGSPAYMAPERFYGQYSHSSDLYAVGILLFELLVGYRPFSGVPADLMSAHLNQPVKIPESVPVGLRTVILKALQKLQARRFESATKMLHALRQAAEIEGWQLDTKQINLPLMQVSAESEVQPFLPLRSDALGAEASTRIGCLAVRVAPLAIAPSETQVNLTEATTKVAVGCLAVEGEIPSEWMYWSGEHQVGWGIYPEGLMSGVPDGKQMFSSMMTLPDCVRRLMVRPQACWVITDRSIVRLMTEMLLAQSGGGSGQRDEMALPEPLLHLGGQFLAEIEAKGRWLVTAEMGAENMSAQFSLWRLPEAALICSPIECAVPNLFRVLALDGCHVAAWFRGGRGVSGEEIKSDGMKLGVASVRDRESSEAVTFVKVLSRRGKWIGSLQLPVALRQVEPSCQPYRVIATELNIPQSCLFIDLKPLKIQRIGIDITPSLMVSTVWGYVLADPQGQIVLLDRYGQQVGQIAGPACPTAISAFGTSGLVISTWDGGKAELYVVDLRESGVDFLF